MLPVINQLESLWKEIVLDLFVEKLSKIKKKKEKREKNKFFGAHIINNVWIEQTDLGSIGSASLLYHLWED